MSGGVVRRLLVAVGVKTDEKGFDKAKKAADSVKKGLLAIVGASVAASAGLYALTKSTAEEADEAAKLARSIGMTTEELTQLRHAANIGGLDDSQLGIGLKTMARNLEAMSRGSGEAKEALAGIDVKDADGNLRGLNDILGDVADRFVAMEDPVKRAAYAQRIFGESGTGMITMLEGGSAGLAKLREEADRLGITISNEAAAEAEAFNDEIARTTGSIKGLVREFAFGLMPGIRKLAEGFRKWISDNREIIKQRLDAAVELISKAMENAVPIAYALAGAIGAIVAISFLSWLNPVGLGLMAIGGWLLATVLILDDLTSAFHGGESAIRDMARALGAEDSLNMMLLSVVPALNEFLGLLEDLGIVASDTEGSVGGIADAVRDLIGLFMDNTFTRWANDLQMLALSLKGVRWMLRGGRSAGQGSSADPAPYDETVGTSYGAGVLADYDNRTDVGREWDREQTRLSGLAPRGGYGHLLPGDSSTKVDVGGVTINADGLPEEKARAMVRDELISALTLAHGGA